MSVRDAELAALFADELRRHLATLQRPDVGSIEVLRALHAVRGSAGMMGETALAETIGRYEQRARAGDGEIQIAAATTIASIIAALDAGDPLPTTRWPDPPEDLQANVPSEELRPLYLAEMRDRIAHIDEALAQGTDASAALGAIRRHVHAVKGAASAVGDTVAVWFVHGFETYLRDEQNKDPDRLLEEAARMRSVLGAIVADPARALAMLRGGPGSVVPSEAPRTNAPESVHHGRSRTASAAAKPITQVSTLLQAGVVAT